MSEEKEEEKNKYVGKANLIAHKYKFLKFHSYSQKELIDLVKELTKLLEVHENVIIKLESEVEKKVEIINKQNEKLNVFYNDAENLEKFVGYKSNWLYIDKIVFVIKRSCKPLHSQQIVDLLLQLEPDLKLKLRNPFNSISKVIYRAVKLNRILQHHKTGNFGYTYVISSE